MSAKSQDSGRERGNKIKFAITNEMPETTAKITDAWPSALYCNVRCYYLRLTYRIIFRDLLVL